MVTPAQLITWDHESLETIAEDLADHRRALTRLSDDLDAARPPASWTFADATAARTEHRALAEALATQVSEAAGVIEALDAAAAAVRSARALVEGALRRAASHGMTVDLQTGAVSSSRTYEDDGALQHAQLVMREVADQIGQALRGAQDADQALTAALTAASTTDVNLLGSLDEQRQILEFQALPVSGQVQHLLDHPEAYSLLAPHVPDVVKQMVGTRIAAELDGAARDPLLMADTEAVARWNTLLEAFGEDPAITGPMIRRLGPDGYLATFGSLTGAMYVGSPSDGLAELADRLRGGLRSATQHEHFDAETFGERLVRYATRQLTDTQLDTFDRAYPTAGGHAATLDYLLRDGDYSEEFIRGVAWQLDTFERDAPEWTSSWMHHNGFASPLNGLDATEPLALHQPDPMAAVMGQLGRHPGLGLEFFSGEAGAERSAFYFAERDWSRDGFAGITTAALGIGTDPTNLADQPQATGMMVATFFDQLPENPRFDAATASTGAEPLARLLKHYMPAVESAIDASSGTDEAPRLRTLAGTYLPGTEHYPLIDRPDLDRLMTVALSTDGGMARIAEGVAEFRQTQLSAFRHMHPDDASVTAHTTALNNILVGSAALDGYVQATLRDIAIDGAVSKDQQTAVFASLVSEAAGLLPVPYADELGAGVGSVGAGVWDAVWSRGQDLPADYVTETFGRHADAARHEETARAEAAQEHTTVATYLSLVHAGILDVPDHLRDRWTPGGQLISASEISAADLQSYRDEAAAAMDNLVVEGTLNAVFRGRFSPWVPE